MTAGQGGSRGVEGEGERLSLRAVPNLDSRLKHGVSDLSVMIALGYKNFRSCWGGAGAESFHEAFILDCDVFLTYSLRSWMRIVVLIVCVYGV